jgi:ParB/RepB/Spo0J family partition protein
MTAQTKAETLSLVSLKDNPAILSRPRAYYVDPSCIDRIVGWNPRFDFGDIDGLADSIRTQHGKDGYGLLMPLHVKAKPGGRFELVDGDRRLTAIELLMKKGVTFDIGVPVEIVDKNDTAADLLIRMMAANTSKPFQPLEEASAYKRMRDEGMTLKQICAAVGRKQVHVNATLALLDADESLVDAVKAGKLSKTDAKEIATAVRGDKQKQKELVAEAVAAQGDKGKQQKAKAAVHKARTEKAKAKGKVLKIRALSDVQLGELGTNVSGKVAELLAQIGKSLDTDMDQLLIKHAKEDAGYELAYTYGLLVALKIAAGAPTNSMYL